MMIEDMDVALLTGMIVGTLLKAEGEGLIKLRARPRVDADGDYQAVVDLYAPRDDRLIFSITVDRVDDYVEGIRRHVFNPDPDARHPMRPERPLCADCWEDEKHPVHARMPL